jgi:hypothetical protein
MPWGHAIDVMPLNELIAYGLIEADICDDLDRPEQKSKLELTCAYINI